MGRLTHTAGPWQAHGGVVTAGTGRDARTVSISRRPEDAAVIAEAPELVELVRKLTAVLAQANARNPIGPIGVSVLSAARRKLESF